ncbi:MAG: YqaJ viral recombinase family protein, partial [Ruminococcus sp.]|nr:YqaJ viral recombinase family protein [Ruminococcus sp.]
MAIDKNYAPKLYCSTENMTEEEWENERRKALGGSDMAVVLGMSPFDGTRLSVYNEKIGKKAVEPMSDKTRVIFDSGHFLENMVADLFSYRTGYETYEVKAMFEHPRHPYLRGNIDRFYRRHGEQAPLGFLECKTTSEFNGGWEDNNIPIHYKIQLSAYMSI